eukprot:s1948_g4.t1
MPSVLMHSVRQEAAKADKPPAGEAAPDDVHTDPDPGKPLSKAEKQKMALARLRERKRLSPPKPCHFREKSSRSRSVERRRESARASQAATSASYNSAAKWKPTLE